MYIKKDYRRIAKNSFVLYIRMLFAMLVSLYTSRVVLNVLGVEDFGLYNVVAGVVVLFSFINMSLSASSSRFINYELGRHDDSIYSLKIVFSTCVYVHIIVALLILLLCESLGIYILYTQIQISPLRLDAAIWVFHLSVISVCVGIMFAPFIAIIIAYEKMKAFAYISIFEVLGKLFIALFLPIILGDRLIIYSLLLLGVTVVVQVVYVIYCYRMFDACRCLSKSNYLLLKKIFAFTGWNLLGDAAYALFTQGLNLLLNIYFGSFVNAARGIAVQVNGVVLRFVQSFQTAINPQIIQSYSNHDKNKVYDLIMLSSRYTFYLITILAVPIFFNVDYLLSVWLIEIPQYTAIFIKIMILISYFDALGYSMTVAVNATGNNRNYQIFVSGTMLLICPISYMCLKFGGAPYSVFLCHLIIGGIAHLFRLFWVHMKIQFPYKPYVNCIFIRGGIILLLSIGVLMIINQIYCSSLLLLFISFVVTCLFVFTIGLTKEEKMYLQNKLKI